jgi:hypothetical protein
VSVQQPRDGYVEVSERLVEFRAKYPDGCLQPADPAVPYRLETVDGVTLVVVVAAAYRTPDDRRPGIGMAWEPCPGRTPFTKFSELQNCETSAWGRALIALGAADAKRGIASADEIRNRRSEQGTLPANRREASDTQASSGLQRTLAIKLGEYGLQRREDRLVYCSGLIGRELASSKELSTAEARQILEVVRDQLAEREEKAPGAPDAG